MHRISSRMTFFYKRLFPVLFLGILLLVMGSGVFGGFLSGSFPPWPFFIGPSVMAVFFIFLMKALIFDLVDEVMDDGTALMVRNNGVECRIDFANIKNVNYQSMIRPPRVTLYLRQPCPLGSKVSFCAPVRLLPFQASPVIDALIDRIDARRLR
jgi:hypothetical protein